MSKSLELLSQSAVIDDFVHVRRDSRESHLPQALEEAHDMVGGKLGPRMNVVLMDRQTRDVLCNVCSTIGQNQRVGLTAASGSMFQIVRKASY